MTTKGSTTTTKAKALISSNRTGAMLAPELTEEMVAATLEFPPSSPQAIVGFAWTPAVANDDEGAIAALVAAAMVRIAAVQPGEASTTEEIR